MSALEAAAIIGLIFIVLVVFIVAVEIVLDTIAPMERR